ncbi:MAG: histidine kinase, partial [Cyanobacteria bacterium P01_F01_bin.42]
RLVLGVTLGMTCLELILLAPSVLRREKELMDYLRSLSSAQAEGVLSAKSSLSEADDQTVLSYLETLRKNEIVLGGALYREDGSLIGTFGEPPELDIDAALAANQLWRSGDLYNRRTQRYDALWQMSPLNNRYQFIIRHDATWVGREFYYYIARFAGIVVILVIPLDVIIAFVYVSSVK